MVLKDVRLNWRERYAIYSLLLYVICTSYIAYLSFEGIINERSWIALFWIIVLFAAMNASLQSFKRELNYQALFFYTIARPRAIIIAKIIYNSGLLILLNLVSYIIYSTFLGNPISNTISFVLCIVTRKLCHSFTFNINCSNCIKNKQWWWYHDNIKYAIIISFTDKPY